MGYIDRPKTLYNGIGDIDNRYNSFNSNYIYSNIYWDFIICYDFSFFFKKVERHYRLLNDTVFSKYDIISRIGEGGNLLDDLQIEISMPQNNYYKLAKLHIEKDRPGLAGEIENLVTEINIHNLQVKELDILIDKYIIDSFNKQFSSPFTWNNKYDINSSYIKDITLKIWNRLMNVQILQ